MEMNTFNFFQTLNEQKLNQLSFCKTSVKSIQTWVEELDLNLLGDTSKALFNAIIEISLLNCTETLRFDLIQAIHPIVHNVLNRLDKNVLNVSLIVDERNQQIIELAISMRLHFAKVYIDMAKNTHRELQEENLSFFSFKLKKNLQIARTLTIYFALKELSLLFYQQQTLYRSAFTGQWLIAHQLFQIAINERIHLQDINQLIGIERKIQNIHQAYAQLIILSIFNTYQIRPIEIESLFLCSRVWAKYIQVLSKEVDSSRYFIDSKQDLPPLFNAYQDRGYQPDLYISTRSLLDYLNQNHKKNTLSEVEKTHLTPALYFHIYNILTNKAERRHERYEYSARIKICFGLQTAHFYLSKTKNFNETLMLNGHYEVQAGLKFKHSSDQFTQLPVNYDTPSLHRENKKIYSVNVIDISVSGYRIRWNGDIPNHLKPGELILVQEHNKSPWRGGLIRWVKQYSETSIDLGLEILAQDLVPCALFLRQKDNQGAYHPALIMQTTQLDEIQTSLILPSISTLKDKQSVQLRVGDQDIKVFLLKPLLITQSFMQFTFELVNEQEQTSFDHYIETQLNEIKHHDLWETLK